MNAPRSRADRFRWYWRISNRIESFIVRRTGTDGIALMRRSHVLVLETTGRRSGRRRRAPVLYWENDGHIFIGGGAAGMTRVDWVANVRANPHAFAWIKRRKIPVVVRELQGAGYDAAKAYAFSRWRGTDRYEVRSGRRIPYFTLEREDERG